MYLKSFSIQYYDLEIVFVPYSIEADIILFTELDFWELVAEKWKSKLISLMQSGTF